MAALCRLFFFFFGGGDCFEDVDLAEEVNHIVAKKRPPAEISLVGRWKKCISMSFDIAPSWLNALTIYLSGSCTGRAFFCYSECLREEWKYHEEMHTFRNVV